MKKTKRTQVVRRKRTAADIAYRAALVIARAERKAKLDAPLQFITPGDLYLYTYKPETTVCGVRG